MTPFMLVLTLILVAIAAARGTRLIVHDVYPPAYAVRQAWIRLVGEDSVWRKLVECHYCASPYVALALWAPVYAFSNQLGLGPMPFGWPFAIVTWLALSYLAAIIVSFDGDNS